MNSAIKDIQDQYDQRDLYTSKAIEEIVDGLNEELRNISFWKLLRNRKNIELNVDVSDLKESIPIDNKNYLQNLMYKFHQLKLRKIIRSMT